VKRSHAWACVAAVLVCAAAKSSAQTVRGRVLERQAGEPVSGVVVLLLDAAENAVARTLSSDGGAYRLIAPGAGSFRIRAMRIGFRPFTTDAIELGAAADLTRDLTVAMIPVLLDSVKSVGRNSCRDRSGTETASVVWEQARTALYATQISSRLPAINASVIAYARFYDPGSSRIREQQTAMSSGFTTAAWATLSADSLRRLGYVIEDDKGWFTFYSPDVNVLLSREFQADHCFRLARSDDNALTGVSFEPSRERNKVSDIKGTVWLDTKTSELRSLEFRYTNVVEAQEEAGAGGQMEFVRMRNGGFAIARWQIRMPVVTLVSIKAPRHGPVGPQQRLAEIRVAGGALVAVTVGADTLWSRPPLTIAGTVTDSASGNRLSSARVSLAGAGSTAVSDQRGQFELRNVLPGEYTVEVRTPSLDSMFAVHRTSVMVDTNTKPLAIRVARADQLARALCAFDKTFTRTSPPGIIMGTSRLQGDSVPPRNVLVGAEWTQTEYSAGGGAVRADGVRRWKEVRTDSRGEFRICGVPANTPVTIRAAGDSAEAAPTLVRIAEGQRFERTELVFDFVAARTAVFAGTVLLDSTDQVISDVEVSLPDLKRSMLTNDEGRFRFSGVPAGEHRIVARRLGYGSLDARVTLAAGQTHSRRVFLTKVPTLDAVDVTASRLPPEFDENRRLGLGHFMTRAELAKVEHATLSGALVGQLPSISVTRVPDPFTGQTVMAVGTRRVVKTESGSPLNEIGQSNGCLSVVYLDKLIVQTGKPTDPLFDLRTLQPDDIEAIQWYASALQVPAEYNSRESKCGVLVIHTRRP
jgi:hypothetical protein